MKLTIIGKNVKITEGIKGALEKKFSKFDKYFNRDDVTGRVLVRTYPVGKKLEITIFTPQMIFRTEAIDNDLYNAMDIAMEKLEGQMRKLKTRMDRSSARMGLSHDIDFDQVNAEEGDGKDVIVRTKSYYLDPMSIEDAITQMEALGHNFFVYLDEEDDRVSVVYIRNDGGYGVIQAENPIKQ